MPVQHIKVTVGERNMNSIVLLCSAAGATMHEIFNACSPSEGDWEMAIGRLMRKMKWKPVAELNKRAVAEWAATGRSRCVATGRSSFCNCPKGAPLSHWIRILPKHDGPEIFHHNLSYNPGKYEKAVSSDASSGRGLLFLFDNIKLRVYYSGRQIE